MFAAASSLPVTTMSPCSFGLAAGFGGSIGSETSPGAASIVTGGSAARTGGSAARAGSFFGSSTGSFGAFMMLVTERRKASSSTGLAGAGAAGGSFFGSSPSRGAGASPAVMTSRISSYLSMSRMVALTSS